MTTTTEPLSKPAKWGVLISDLADAVKWIETNCLRLPGSVNISCVPGGKVAIHLGYYTEGTEGADAVMAMFAGSEATKFVSTCGDTYYEVISEGIEFRWTFWAKKADVAERKETVTL